MDSDSWDASSALQEPSVPRSGSIRLYFIELVTVKGDGFVVFSQRLGSLVVLDWSSGANDDPLLPDGHVNTGFEGLADEKEVGVVGIDLYEF